MVFAIAPDLNKAFISEGQSSTIKVINLQTLAVIADVKIDGRNPDAIIYDQYSKRVFAFNGGSSNASVIDAVTNAALGDIALDGKPEAPASDGKGKLFVNIEDKNEITVIDVKTMKVLKSWPIDPGEEASGLALDIETNRLFAVCGNTIMVVMDATDGHIVTTLPIGDGCDGVKFDPTMKRAFTSNGEGTMTVVQEVTKDSFKVVENFPTASGARTLAVDTKTHHIYMSASESTAGAGGNGRPGMNQGQFFVMDIAPVIN